MDLIDASTEYSGLMTMLSLAGTAGLAFGSGMDWYFGHLNRTIPLLVLAPAERFTFRQFARDGPRLPLIATVVSALLVLFVLG